jgi:hypothetical protein
MKLPPKRLSTQKFRHNKKPGGNPGHPSGFTPSGFQLLIVFCGLETALSEAISIPSKIYPGKPCLSSGNPYFQQQFQSIEFMIFSKIFVAAKPASPPGAFFLMHCSIFISLLHLSEINIFSNFAV